MATPIHTIPNWVPNKINPKILFITENYPGDPNDKFNNSYVYRSLHPTITRNKPNNLLNNLCTTLGIHAADEPSKLDQFMNKKEYFLIDSFPHNSPMNKDLINKTIHNSKWIDQLIDDLVNLNPKQIIFTCLGSNGKLLPKLQERAAQRGIKILDRIVSPISVTIPTKVFRSPSNRWIHDQKRKKRNGGEITYQGFTTQIWNAIQSGKLIP